MGSVNDGLTTHRTTPSPVLLAALRCTRRTMTLVDASPALVQRRPDQVEAPASGLRAARGGGLSQSTSTSEGVSLRGAARDWPGRLVLPAGAFGSRAARGVNRDFQLKLTDASGGTRLVGQQRPPGGPDGIEVRQRQAPARSNSPTGLQPPTNGYASTAAIGGVATGVSGSKGTGAGDRLPCSNARLTPAARVADLRSARAAADHSAWRRAGVQRPAARASSTRR